MKMAKLQRCKILRATEKIGRTAESNGNFHSRLVKEKTNCRSRAFTQSFVQLFLEQSAVITRRFQLRKLLGSSGYLSAMPVALKDLSSAPIAERFLFCVSFFSRYVQRKLRDW